MASTLLAVSFFRNKKDNVPQASELSWDELSLRLNQHDERGNKDGALWSPTRYKPGTTRANVNVVSVSCLVLDFDSGKRIEELSKGWDGLACAVHTTFQHTSKAPRWRGVFPLAQEARAAEWPDLWAALARRFGGTAIDAACKDVSRMYYLPSCPPGIKRDAWVSEGRWLDPVEFLRPSIALLVDKAKGELRHGRNVAGMWLACQLRDNCYSASDAEGVRWHLEVQAEKKMPDGKVALYTAQEWLDTVRKVYARPAREPWNYSNGTNGKQPTSEESKPSAAPSEPEPRRRSWATARELCAKDIPPMEWVVPGIIPEGLSILGGRPKQGKSWGIYGVGLAVATGGLAFGKLAVAKGDVLYLALEDSERRLQERMRTLLHGAPPPAVFDWAINWPKLSPPGKIVNPGDPDCIQDIIWWLDEHPKARLVVIDTLARIKPRAAKGGNAYEDDTEALAPLHRLALERRFGLVLLTHTRKPPKPGATSDFLDEIQGSTGITGIADTILGLKKTGDQQVALFVRGRDVDEQELLIDWDPDTCDWKLLGDASSIRLTPIQKQCVSILRKSEGPVHYRKVAHLLEKEGRSAEEAIGVTLRRLADREVVKRASDGFFFVTPD